MEPALGTVVGGEVAVRGHVHGTRDVTVNGKLEGTVELAAGLTIGPDALVKAEIRVQRAHVHGAVIGAIIASEEILLHAGSRVVGDLFAPSVVMEDGALFRGMVRDPAEAPARAAQPGAVTTVTMVTAPPPPSPALVEAGLSPLPPRPPARPAPVRRAAEAPALPSAAPVVDVTPMPAPAPQPIKRVAAVVAPPADEGEAEEETPPSRREVRRRAPRVSPAAEREEQPAQRPRPAVPMTPPAARPLPGRGTAVALKRR